MIQTKYLVSLIFLFSGGANGIAFGSRFLNSGGAFLQRFNDNLRKNSQDLTDLTQKETDRLLKEKKSSDLITNELDSKNKKRQEYRDQTNASKKEVEAKLKAANESHEQKNKELKEYQKQVQQSYEEEVRQSTQKIQSEAKKLAEKFQKTWDEQDKQIQKILEEIKASNKKKIEQLFKDIEGLPNRIFLENPKKD